MVRKRFGQHFLVDDALIDRIHKLLSVRETDSVLEIGPGRGALTQGLADSGAEMVAIEIDRDLIAQLRGRFPSSQFIEANVLEAESQLFSGKRIVGNLPYNISTPLLLRLTTVTDFVDAHFMLQREVVDRMTATHQTKEWGRLSVNVQLHWQIDRLFDVDPDAFEPAPEVTSSYVRIVPRSEVPAVDDRSIFDEVLRTAFSQRRKMVSNSLQAFGVRWDDIGLSDSLRADQLTVEDYVEIANSISSRRSSTDGG